LTLDERKRIIAILFRFLSPVTFRMRRPLLTILSLLSLVVAAGRAASADVAAKPGAGKSETAKTEANKANYLLQPLDLLKVQVFQEEEINKLGEVRVSQEYTISLPLIGTIDLKGKTSQQATEMIRKRYDRDYIIDPQVSVQVIEYAKRTVNVVGQVNQPGQVDFPQEQGLTLVDAISRAKGPTRLANMKKVVLKRTNPDGTTDVQTINVDDLMKTESKDTFPLQPGDVITVPERSI
jgi:polysaccharide export outer membrane protein